MEKYEPFIPKEIILPSQVHFLSLTDNSEGFIVKVSAQDDDENIIDIHFETVLAYVSIDEGDRLRLWERFDFSQQTFLYKVRNSVFMKNYHVQSYNIHSEESLEHFFLVTTDSCFDVISEVDPEVIIK